MKRLRTVLLAVGFLGLVFSYAYAACPAAPSYTGPTISCGESGSDSFGFGSCVGNSAVVDVNYLSAGDDCDRDVSKSHHAVEAFVWTLQAPAGCTYDVDYYFTATYAIGCFAETDNALDCDYGEGAAAAQVTCETNITSKEGAVWSSNGPYVEDSDSGTMQSPSCTKLCVPAGTLFLCNVGAQATGQAVSEARGGGSGDYGDPTFWHTETLCPSSGD